MNTQPELRELLLLLENHKVDYMIVGGYAVAFHGYVRNTKHLNIFYRGTPENIALLREALLEFGFTESDLSSIPFADKEIVSFGNPPMRVDLLNDIDGISFDEAASHRTIGPYGDITTKYISKNDLIRNKKASQRFQDMADVEKLS